MRQTCNVCCMRALIGNWDRIMKNFEKVHWLVMRTEWEFYKYEYGSV